MEDQQKAPYTSLPAESLSLWEVHYWSVYRDCGDTYYDHRLYVLAENDDVALEKARDRLLNAVAERVRNNEMILDQLNRHKKITVSPIALEDLMIARDASKMADWNSKQKMSEVQLSLEEDLENFKLGVCLVPK